MAEQLSLPDSISSAYWIRTATKDVEKLANLERPLDNVSKAVGEVNKALKVLKVEVDADHPNPTKAAEMLAKEVEGGVIKAIEQMLSGPLKQLEQAADKAAPAVKKAGKESSLKSVTSSLKVFRNASERYVADLRAELKDLIAGNKPAAKSAGGDKKKDEALGKLILRYNLIAKKSVRELRAGKVRSLPFVFAAHKKPVPYKKGAKDWPTRSVMHLHLKAGQSSRTMLAKIVDSSPDFFMGEVRCEDRKKLIFDFTKSAVAPAKKLKDALLFQCGFAPPFKLIKGGKVEGDEGGDGEDNNEPIDNIPEEDDDNDTDLQTSEVAAKTAAAKKPAGKPEDEGAESEAEDEAAQEAAYKKTKAEREALSKRFTGHSAAIQAAIKDASNKDKGQAVRALAIELGKVLAPGGDLKEAAAKLKELEDVLSGKSTGTPAAKSAQGEAAFSSPELQAVLRDLAALRGRAVAGVTRVAELIRQAYQGDPQAAKAVEGAKRVDASKNSLKADVEAQITTVLNTADKARRAALASQTRANVAKYRAEITGHDLLSDIDESDFDKSLKVIKPYVDALARAETLLGAVK